MAGMHSLELLSPARDLACGIGAIDHGADAVYIGAPKFGARAAAGNSFKDIGTLIAYARKYRVRVYIALNTILLDAELEDARAMVQRVYEEGADALIIQDMAFLEMDLPPLPLFASTQTHNEEPARIRFLEDVGFARVILARELSLQHIREIRATTHVELEAFIHGALCVSYSGRCYFSQFAQGRSANRGECAQMCRLPYTLTDSKGNVLARDRHVLSLRDLNLSDLLADLVDAGITSFKIEGRLKDAGYVKNITAFYRAQLDDVLEQRPDHRRASSGRTVTGFVPDPARSFNRGFTDYFLRGRSRAIASPHTPKSLGKAIGRVRSVHGDSFTLDTEHTLHNGDGICFFDSTDVLRGVHINTVEGSTLSPDAMPDIRPGTVVYRNHDIAFVATLQGMSARRTIGLHFFLEEQEDGFTLRGVDDDGVEGVARVRLPRQQAQTPGAAREHMRRHLARLGTTMFHLAGFTYTAPHPAFLPAAVLNRMRRECVTALEAERMRGYHRKSRSVVPNNAPYPGTHLDKYANVVNALAAAFYRRHGIQTIEPGVELQAPSPGTILMRSRYCLKYQFDLCGGKNDDSGELFLLHGAERYRVACDCDRCEMTVTAP